MKFEDMIKPFFWVKTDSGASVCLNAGEYLEDLFETRREEGFEGNGYDWASLAQVFLDEKCEDSLQEEISFDPEADMFSAYAEDAVLLKQFIIAFKEACEDRAVISDLFSRAELD